MQCLGNALTVVVGMMHPLPAAVLSPLTPVMAS